MSGEFRSLDYEPYPADDGGAFVVIVKDDKLTWYVGPFRTTEDVIEWAMAHDGSDFRVASLQDPSDFLGSADPVEDPGLPFA